MNFLLDTCVVSELSRSVPDPRVLDWFEHCPDEALHISVLTLGEIRYGIDQLPPGRKKRDLLSWFESVESGFAGSTVAVDSRTAIGWGALRARLRAKGISLPIVDGLLAASALEHDFVLVTRNTEDVAATGVRLLNPWRG